MQPTLVKPTSASKPKNPYSTSHAKQNPPKKLADKEQKNVPTKAFQKMTLQDAPAKPTTLHTQNIHFTQATVSETFSDGKSIAEVTTRLINGTIKPHDIETIRVVFYQKKWMALDNRRLRAFKDAFVEEIPVVICDLNDHAIKREFHTKRSNKSSNAGGAIRSRIQTDSKEHFEEGTFKFTKQILTWNFEQLKYPLPGLSNKALGIQFTPETYYSSFLNLILEEARACLQTGIEAIETKATKSINLSLIEFKRSNNAQNPSTFKFFRQWGNNSVIKSYDAFILRLHPEENQADSFQLLALASTAPGNDDNIVKFKTIVDQDLQQNFSSVFLTKETRWQAIPLGSLVTHLRMYDVCTAAPRISWLDELCSGQLNNNILSKDAPEEKELLQQLNDSQQQAVSKFLALKQGIQLVQGPPGTGKTTTAVTLLEMLAKQKRRVLICAPSNKAVQVLVESFIASAPDVPVILAGVEDKLPEDNSKLREVFIHTWGQMRLDQVRQIREQLWDLTPDKLFSGKKEEVKNNIKIAINTIKQIRNDFKKFRVIFRKYKFNPTSRENLTKIRTTLKQYQEFLEKNTALDAEFDKHYSHYKEINPKQTENLETALLAKFNQVRQWLSQCVGVLNNLELRLQTAIDDDTKQGLEARLLNCSQLIFATLSVSGRKALKDMDAIQDLVIDEAAQSVEAETLIPLTARPQRCLLIGDTKQLPATVLSTKAAELGFERSLMWRLLEEGHQPYTMLMKQFRMHSEIRQWPSAQYYDARLFDSPTIQAGEWYLSEMKDAPSCFTPYAFIDVPGHEIKAGHSFKNMEEAELIVKVVAHLQKQYQIDVKKQIGVITFYKAQAELINSKLQPDFPGIKVNTVDSFQGAENDIILISFVRANAKGSIGFLNDFRRLNVALTRAKYSLLLFGNAARLEKQAHDVALLVKDARSRKFLFKQQDMERYLNPTPVVVAKQSQYNKERFFKKTTALTHEKEEKVAAPIKSSLYKTQLCYFFSQSPSSCRNGDTCNYAHSKQELRFK